MSNILLMLFVLAMIIVPCVAVVALGLWFKRRASRVSPESTLVRKLTPTGIALNSGFALILLGGAVVRQFAPQSEIGALLATPTHIFLALLALWVLFIAGSVVASKLGHLHPNDAGYPAMASALPLETPKKLASGSIRTKQPLVADGKDGRIE